MKKIHKVIAMLLVVCLLLSGCSMLEEVGNVLAGYLGEDEYLSFEEMVYERPDVNALYAKKDALILSAAESTDAEALMEEVFAFFDDYQWFYTNLNLADIHYCIDLTDTYWQTEYNYCMEESGNVDAAREEVLYALADSPLREELEHEDYFGADYFDSYEGESIYNEELLALMEQEAALENEYYAISAEAANVEYCSEEYYTAYGTQMAQVLVELVKVRQAQAACLGYDSYPEFANDFYHGRGFTTEEAIAYTDAVAENLAALYRQVNSTYDWSMLYETCYEDQVFDYVKNTAEAMGGVVESAFDNLEVDGLYHISYGENKYNSSFEVYLSSYDQPFIFVNPSLDQSDKLTFAHEFGHFAADYMCWSSDAGTDVLEVHSQAMEYLSLIYGQADPALVEYKMVDCLCTYVEQSAYARFELELYELEGDALTVENVQALYESIGNRFGFDSWGWDSRDYVTVTHFFTYPVYIISYVVSNDLALQIYQQEQQSDGAGLATYEQILESAHWEIMSFAEDYDLQNPLDPARLEAVRQTLEEALK